MREEVAMEEDVTLATPELEKPRGYARRNSTGNSSTKASSSLSYSDEKPLSRYLRAPIGSCHDKCKFGRKYEEEPKKRLPICHWLLGGNGTANDEHDPSKILTPQERRNKMELKLKQQKSGSSKDSQATMQKYLLPATDSQEDDSYGETNHAVSEEPIITKLMNSVGLASDEHAPAKKEPPMEAITIHHVAPPTMHGKAVSAKCALIPIPFPEHTPGCLVERSFQDPISIELMSPSTFQETNAYDEHMASFETPVPFPEHTPGCLVERPFQDPISIELMSPSTFQETNAYDEHMASFETPVLNEESSQEPVSIELMASSTFQDTVAYNENTPPARAECSSIKLRGLELNTSSTTQGNSASVEHSLTCEAVGPSAASSSTKPKNISFIQQNKASVKRACGIPAENSSGALVRMKLKSPLPVRRSVSSSERVQSNRAGEQQDRVRYMDSGDRKKKQVAMLKNSSHPNSSGPKPIKQKKINVFKGLDIIKGKTSSPVKKAITSVEPKSSKEKDMSTFEKIVTSGTPKITKASSPHTGIFLSARSKLPLQAKTAEGKYSSLSASSGRTGRKHINRVIRSSGGPSKDGEKKPLEPSKDCLSSNGLSSMVLKKLRNVKHTSPLKNQVKGVNRGHDIIVKEKILYVIEPKQENIDLKQEKDKLRKHELSLSRPFSSLSPSPSSSPIRSSYGKVKHEDSDSAFSESSGSNSVVKGSRNKKPSDATKGEDRMRSRRTPIYSQVTPHKLQFRRGKVVSLPAAINNGPRRLRFKQARAVTESHDIEVVGRGFTKREDTILKTDNSNGVDSNPSSIESPAVVLRHQDVQGKKDPHALLNRVIEETASKLVETRKSKVKALVSAFETVISLK